jgi:hypothetical protein
LGAEQLFANSSYPIIEIWLEKQLVGRLGHTPDVDSRGRHELGLTRGVELPSFVVGWIYGRRWRCL